MTRRSEIVAAQTVNRKIYDEPFVVEEIAKEVGAHTLAPAPEIDYAERVMYKKSCEHCTYWDGNAKAKQMGICKARDICTSRIEVCRQFTLR
jgi:hypothetical protein